MAEPADSESVLPEIVSRAADLRARVAAWRDGRPQSRVALVPTMGALHAGHLALVKAARARAERVVVSIFVNPTQFAPNEDFNRYPRDLAKDRAALGPTADLIYAPPVAEIYPAGFATRIVMEGPARGLESDARPHFFSGVAIVVAKLFLHCSPDFAVFGEKDYQQLLVVRQLVRDLDLGLDVAGIPTIREADGLALSSRNAYLSTAERAVAVHLNRVLDRVAERARIGISIPQAEAEGAAALLEAGFSHVDYVALRDAGSLAPIAALDGPARVLAAARVGGTRLIDNKPV